jgi:hypothetical protein
MSSDQLSEQQRRGLCDLLYWAFLDLRDMHSPDRALQASKLAYALHNVPHLIFADRFDWEKVEGPLRYYQSQFYETDATRGYDYLKMIAQIRNGELVVP